jgi:hypothetical protein
MKLGIVHGVFLAGMTLLAASSASAESPPPSSPLAQVREGMRMAAVTDAAGQPTASCTHITGKAFIPLYPSNDKEVTELHYKGQGRVILSGGGVTPQVIRVEYDPSESGVCGSTD